MAGSPESATFTFRKVTHVTQNDNAKARRIWTIAGIAFVHIVQVALVGGGWFVHQLTTEKMMVMRYFVAKNALWEQTLFSPAGHYVQLALAGILALMFAASSVHALRHRISAGTVETFVATVISLALAALIGLMDTGDSLALYALTVAGWAALVLQVALVVALIARSHKKRD